MEDLKHEEWLRRRKQPDKASIAKALRTLGAGGRKPSKDDALPEGYVSVRGRGLGGAVRWAGATKEAIEWCRVPLEDAGVALVVCWEELAEMLVWVAKSGDGGTIL